MKELVKASLVGFAREKTGIILSVNMLQVTAVRRPDCVLPGYIWLGYIWQGNIWPGFDSAAVLG